jgi:DNA-binding response OmpR family regulator
MRDLKVLLVEDEDDIRELLTTHLESEGMRVMGLSSGAELIATMKKFKPNIVLMDHRMPGKSGRELAKEIRAKTELSMVPIVMVSGLGSEDDKLEAFAFGVDDYVTKPFSLSEIAARIRAVTKRALGQQISEEELVYENLKINLNSHAVTLGKESLKLTLTEFKILAELMRSSGKVLTRDALRSRALQNLNVTDRTIDVHMASLRKKLGRLGNSIFTVRGIGYKVIARD